MSATTELRSCLELALADACPLPKVMAPGRMLEVQINLESFEKLMKHWASLPPASRPRLRGISVSRDGAGSLLLQLEIGARVPFLLISVERSSRPFPALSTIWPFSSWWEDELVETEKVSFAGKPERGGVAWRRA